MNRIFSSRPLIAAALALGALAATSAAQARSDVFLSIGVQAPYGYVQPQPVYVQPQPVYVRPEPVYVRPQPVYVQPQPVYYDSHRRYRRGGPWGDADGDGVPNIHDRDSRFYEGRGYRDRAWGDVDRDGVPDRWDRAPHNPYRR